MQGFPAATLQGSNNREMSKDRGLGLSDRCCWGHTEEDLFTAKEFPNRGPESIIKYGVAVTLEA